jgi:hypothetical protein
MTPGGLRQGAATRPPEVIRPARSRAAATLDTLCDVKRAGLCPRRAHVGPEGGPRLRERPESGPRAARPPDGAWIAARPGSRRAATITSGRVAPPSSRPRGRRVPRGPRRGVPSTPRRRRVAGALDGGVRREETPRSSARSPSCAGPPRRPLRALTASAVFHPIGMHLVLARAYLPRERPRPRASRASSQRSATRSRTDDNPSARGRPDRPITGGNPAVAAVKQLCRLLPRGRSSSRARRRRHFHDVPRGARSPRPARSGPPYAATTSITRVDRGFVRDRDVPAPLSWRTAAKAVLVGSATDPTSDPARARSSARPPAPRPQGH